MPAATPTGVTWLGEDKVPSWNHHHRQEHNMDWTLEVVILPVSDIDRSVAFYRDKVGFDLDHDTTNEHMHVVQLTPRGSGCSIVFGDLPNQREMEPGSMKGLQRVVADPTAAREERLGRAAAGGVRACRSRLTTRTEAPSSASPTRTAIPGPCRN